MSPDQNRLFTPDLKEGETYSGETMQDGRALMSLSPEDARIWENAKEEDSAAVVTDQNTGTRWLVQRSDCGLGCRCAALAESVVGPA